MGKSFAIAVSVIALLSAGVFAARIWWLPPDISALGLRIDGQLAETMVFTGVLFVAAQLALAAFVWQSTGRTATIRLFPGGPMPLVGAATAIVGLEVLALVFIGTRVWSQAFLTPAPANAIHIDVQAGQFAFYFRYAGPDGKFGVPHPELINEGESNFFGLDPKKYIGMVHFEYLPMKPYIGELTARFAILKVGRNQLTLEFHDAHVM